jgi:hypothetical protein
MKSSKHVCESGPLEARNTCHALAQAHLKGGRAESSETWPRPFHLVDCMLCHVQMKSSKHVCESGPLEARDTCHALAQAHRKVGRAEPAQTWPRPFHLVDCIHCHVQMKSSKHVCESGPLEARNTCHALAQAHLKGGRAESAETWPRPFHLVDCIHCHVQMKSSKHVCESGPLEARDTCRDAQAHRKVGRAEPAESWPRPFHLVDCIHCHLQMKSSKHVCETGP